MKTTIDQAGRVVIPKPLRQKFHLTARTEIEILADGDGLRLQIPTEESSLVEKNGVVVHCTDGKANLDSTEFINQFRDGRNQNSAGPIA